MSTDASSETRLVGRLDELARISGLLERVTEGGGGLVLRGDVGVGKTNLLETAVDLANVSASCPYRPSTDRCRNVKS